MYYHDFDGKYIVGYRVDNGETTKRLVLKTKVQQASFFNFLSFFRQDCDENYNTSSNFCDQGLEEIVISSGGSGSGVAPYYSLFTQELVEEHNSGGGGGDSEGGGGGNGSGNTTQQQTCTGGKVYNTTTKSCQCPQGTAPNQAGNCVVIDPCAEINQQILDPDYISKVNELKTKTTKKVENGYRHNKDGTFSALTRTAVNGHSLIINADINTIGFAHTHLDSFLTGGYDSSGNPEEKKPIRMFSPQDLITFLSIAKNTQRGNVSVANVYGTVVTSIGTYMLKFADDPTTIPNISASHLKKDYLAYMEKYPSNKEKAFLKFLKHSVKIDGVKLYKVESDGSVKKKELSSNENVDTTNC